MIIDDKRQRHGRHRSSHTSSAKRIKFSNSMLNPRFHQTATKPRPTQSNLPVLHLTLTLLLLLLLTTSQPDALTKSLLSLNQERLGGQVLAFNIDTQSAIVHQGPANSYFGYSVAQHRDRGVNWLLVGAPKAQTDQPKTERAGAVYKCSPSNPKACQQIPFDPNGSSVIQLRGEPKQSDDKSHQGFGSSLQSANDNGSIVACAPRYVYYSTNLKRRDPVGTCWVSRGSFSGFLEYSPCRLNGKYWLATLFIRHNRTSPDPSLNPPPNQPHLIRPMGTPSPGLLSGGFLKRHHKGM